MEIGSTGLTAPDIFKVGTNGSTFTQIQKGSQSYSTVLNAGSGVDVTINFPSAFGSTPVVLVAITKVTGGAWDQCNVQSKSVTTTSFIARIENFTAGATSGNATINYIAFT